MALEVKTETGRLTRLQELFLDKVKKAGAVGEVVRSVEDVKEILLTLEGGG